MEGMKKETHQQCRMKIGESVMAISKARKPPGGMAKAISVWHQQVAAWRIENGGEMAKKSSRRRAEESKKSASAYGAL
jgi:hypothetical protein